MTRKVNKKTAAKRPAKSAARGKRLGRGLTALLGDVRPADAASAAEATDDSPRLRELPIELLQRGKYQPRTAMDKAALDELAETIRAQGVLQPLLVRAADDGRFEIIAGERRWRAAQLAGLQSVPAVVREVSDQNAMAVALIENIQRKDLNAIEEAAGLQRLLDEFGLTHQQAADAVGRSRSTVTNLLRLLGLHPAARKLLAEGKIEMGHARTLLQLSGEAQAEAARKVADEGLSVRRTEALVKTVLAAGGKAKAGRGEEKSPDVLRLEESLSARLGARISIDGGQRGKVVIYYHSLEELDGILGRIK